MIVFIVLYLLSIGVFTYIDIKLSRKSKIENHEDIAAIEYRRLCRRMNIW